MRKYQSGKVIAGRTSHHYSIEIEMGNHRVSVKMNAEQFAEAMTNKMADCEVSIVEVKR